jgi:hypothetical protein
VRVGGDEVLGLTVQVSEVAAAASGNQDLFADTASAFQNCHASSALACLDGAHEARGAAPENNDVEFFFHDQRCPRGGGDSACISKRKSAGGSQSNETSSRERG